MVVLAHACTFWQAEPMRRGTFLTPVSGVATRFGRLTMAGEVRDAVPIVPRPVRVMDEWVISLVHAGSGHYRHGDGRLEYIGPGTLTIVPPHVPHWYGTDGSARWSEVFAVVDGPLPSLLGQVGVLPGAGSRPMPVAGRGEQRWSSAADAARDLLMIVTGAPRTRAQAERQLLDLAGWLVDATAADGEARTGEPSGSIERAARELAADAVGQLSMHEVAQRAGLPYDAFRRRFRAQMGCSPARYRNAQRLRTAADLLRFTTLSLREVAERLGYTDEFHLSRRFKQHFGVPPSQYRKPRRP